MERTRAARAGRGAPPGDPRGAGPERDGQPDRMPRTGEVLAGLALAAVFFGSAALNFLLQEWPVDAVPLQAAVLSGVVVAGGAYLTVATWSWKRKRSAPAP